MPWQNASTTINHNTEDLISIRIEWLDASPNMEFSTTPFVYAEDRVNKANAPNRNEFKLRAETARNNERSRLQKIKSFNNSVLTFMNA